jgi:ribosomal protein S18 acetylase RimI-like enzyme
VTIRPLVAGDREAVATLLVRTGSFTDDEVATAVELIDEWLARGESSGYFTYVAGEAGDTICGYVCFGPAPLTDGTYDLYWIAVGPEAQGHGVGRQLMAFAEADVVRRAGRLLLIETSSQAGYQSTVEFYERCGYRLAARIDNYYRPGDDKLIYAKTLSA